MLRYELFRLQNITLLLTYILFLFQDNETQRKKTQNRVVPVNIFVYTLHFPLYVLIIIIIIIIIIIMSDY